MVYPQKTSTLLEATSAGSDDEKPSSSTSEADVHFFLDGRRWSCGLVPMMGIDTLKSMALSHFLSPNEAVATLGEYRLAHIRQRRVLSEDGDVSREGLEPGDDVLILRKRRETLAEALERTPTTPPTLEEIRKATAHLTPHNVPKKRQPSPSIPDLATNIRRILMALCRRAVALQGGNPLSSAIILQAKEKLETKLNPQVDSVKLQILRDMGFSENRAAKALLMNRMNVPQAMEWLLVHSSDADIDEPFNLRLLARQARDRRHPPGHEEREVCNEELNQPSSSVLEAQYELIRQAPTQPASRTGVPPTTADSVRILFRSQNQFRATADDGSRFPEDIVMESVVSLPPLPDVMRTADSSIHPASSESTRATTSRDAATGTASRRRRSDDDDDDEDDDDEEDDEPSLEEPLSGLSLPSIPIPKQPAEETEPGPSAEDILQLLDCIREYRRRLFLPSKRSLAAIKEMGFSEADAALALRAANNTRDAAIEWLLGGQKPSMLTLEAAMHPEAPMMKVILSNSVVVTALAKPKILSALIGILVAPRSASQWMSDPDISLVLQTIYRIYHTEKRYDAFWSPTEGIL